MHEFLGDPRGPRDARQSSSLLLLLRVTFSNSDANAVNAHVKRDQQLLLLFLKLDDLLLLADDFVHVDVVLFDKVQMLLSPRIQSLIKVV